VVGPKIGMPPQFTVKSIPPPTSQWADSGWQNGPSRYEKYGAKGTGFYLYPIRNLLKAGQSSWYVSFKFMACDLTREWILFVPADQVWKIMDTVLFFLKSVPNKKACLHLYNTFPSPHVDIYTGNIKGHFFGNNEGDTPFPTFPNDTDSDDE
jgi:hypothetical protein